MGKFSISLLDHSTSTMRIIGMCDQKRSAPCSDLCNGNVDLTSLSITTDVDDLKGGADVESTRNVKVPQSLGELSHFTSLEATCRAGNGSCSNLSVESPGSEDLLLDKTKDSFFVMNNGEQHSNDSEEHVSMYAQSSDQNLHIQTNANVDSYVQKHYLIPTMNTTSCFMDDVSVEVGASEKLSKVLENICLPLLYIPTTKQLATNKTALSKDYTPLSVKINNVDINVKTTMHTPYSRKSHSDLEPELTYFTLLSAEQPLTPLLSIPKAHRTQECQSSWKQQVDMDHITVHSMDSPTGFSHDLEPTSFIFCDTSSLSNISTNTDLSISSSSLGGDESIAESKSLSHIATDRAVFMDINLHTRNSFDMGTHQSAPLDSRYTHPDRLPSQATKKKPFIGFKNLFSKRENEESPLGWKLFGKIPPKSTPRRNHQEIISEFQIRNRITDAKQQTHASRPATDVMSTTALILENRPMNLPTKSREETENHRQQYEEMIEAAKKKEQKDIKLKKKQLQMQRKLEDQLMFASQMWNSEILPNWDSMRSSKKTCDLWWLGLPPNVRGKVWKLAIGNDLNITHELYEICQERAEERVKIVQSESIQLSSSYDKCSRLATSCNKESSVKVIKLDVSRTFPQLCIFQKGGPYYDLLHSLLGAYACYRPDVGYVQGMSFIAAILLLNMDVADAFVCFANLLNRPCQLAFFRMDEHLMSSYYRTFEDFFRENLPKLFVHFNWNSVTPNLYLMEWVFLLYSKSLPLDVACRVWDVFCRDGEEFLFRTAISILKLYECPLLEMDFIHMAQFLTKLPDDICADQLFKVMDSVRMSSDKKGFNSVNSFYKDLTEPAGCS